MMVSRIHRTIFLAAAFLAFSCGYPVEEDDDEEVPAFLSEPLIRRHGVSAAPVILPVAHSFLLTDEEADDMLIANHEGSASKLRFVAERHPMENVLRRGDNEIIIPMGELHHNHFVGEVSIGTPPQKFQLVFDTGSTNVQVVGDACFAPSCVKVERFRPYSSSTFRYTADPPVGVEITFGTGRIHTKLGIDTVAIGPYKVHQQALGVIDRELGQQGMERSIFDKIEFQGMVGFGFPAMSSANRTPFFDNLMQQPQEVRQFSIYMGPTGRGLAEKRDALSAFVIDGIDRRFFHGELRFVPVAKEHYWQLQLESLWVGDTKFCCAGGTENFVIIDSGTTYNTLPFGEIEAFHRLVPTVDCDWDNPLFLSRFPTIKYVLAGGLQLIFKPEQYIAEVRRTDGSKLCKPAYMQIDVPAQHGHSYILGSLVYMRNYFTVFRRAFNGEGPSSIGIAPAKHSPDVAALLQNLSER